MTATGVLKEPRRLLWRRQIRLRQLWTTAGAFALVLMTQVGFVVHLAAFPQPTLRPADTAGALSGVTVAVIIGRLALGLVIDRLEQ